jgi:hypothetical protein
MELLNNSKLSIRSSCCAVDEHACVTPGGVPLIQLCAVRCTFQRFAFIFVQWTIVASSSIAAGEVHHSRLAGLAGDIHHRGVRSQAHPDHIGPVEVRSLVVEARLEGDSLAGHRHSHHQVGHHNQDLQDLDRTVPEAEVGESHYSSRPCRMSVFSFRQWPA